MKQIVTLHVLLPVLGLLPTACCVATCSAADKAVDVVSDLIPAYDIYVAVASEAHARLADAVAFRIALP